MQLSSSVVVITGGASGLGAGVARRTVEAGGCAAIIDLAGDRGDRLVAELGERSVFLPTDITSPGEVSATVDAAAERFGRIDVLVSCAGVADTARVISRSGELFPLETYRKVVDVNLIGLFDVLRHCVRHMVANEPDEDGCRGVIVNVASIAGIEGQAGQAAYSASKGGVIGMTLPLARDLGSSGIRVNTVCPGVFDTAMLAGTEDKIRNRLLDLHVMPKRLGTPRDFALLVGAIVENPMLNGEVIRLDAGARLPHG